MKLFFLIIMNFIFVISICQNNYPWMEMYEQDNADYEKIVFETDSFYELNPDLKGADGSTYKKSVLTD